MIETLSKVVYYFNYMVLIYFLLIISIYLILNLVSARRMINYSRRIRYSDLNRIIKLKNYKPISIITPAFNEATGIIDCVKALLQLDYPEYQVIIVNDGSTDETMEKLFESFKIRQVAFSAFNRLKSKPIKSIYMSTEFPSLVVIDKENGGKADAINAGINLAKYPLITTIDADSLLERDCLIRISRPFIEDTNVVAVGGTIRIANGCEINHGHVERVGLSKSWVARFQVIEYLRAFLFGRNGFDVINGIMIISGAFSCFYKEALVKAGGYRTGSVGEDMEIIVRMHKLFRRENKKTKITFIPDPVCWTEAPENFKILKSQRKRWQKGTMESVLLHKSLFLNSEYGWLGLLVFPYFVIFETIGPFIEVTGYFVFAFSMVFGIISFSFAIAFFLAAFFYGVVLSVLSVFLEEISFRKYPKTDDLINLFIAAILENFGYRQLITWWRFLGMIEYLFGNRGWGKMEKKGF